MSEIEGQSPEGQREEWEEVVGIVESADGQTYAVTNLDLVGRDWRRLAVAMLKVVAPDKHQQYREIKYSGGPEPDFATRAEAYSFAVETFLRLSYRIPAGL